MICETRLRCLRVEGTLIFKYNHTLSKPMRPLSIASYLFFFFEIYKVKNDLMVCLVPPRLTISIEILIYSVRNLIDNILHTLILHLLLVGH